MCNSLLLKWKEIHVVFKKKSLVLNIEHILVNNESGSDCEGHTGI